MAIVLDPASKSSFQSLVNPSNALNFTWTNPDTSTVYTIANGFLRNAAVNGEPNDNVKFQAQPGETVYVYTVHNNITSNVDNPDTVINETARHSGIVTYAVNRDDAGNVSVTLHDVQNVMVDSVGREYGFPETVTPNIEHFSTDQGDFLLVKYLAPTRDVDGDGDLDTFAGTAIYAIGSDGKTTPVDAKVWDQRGVPGQIDTVETQPGNVNTNFPDSPYVSSTADNQANFSFVQTETGTPVLMQMVDSNNGTLTTINPDGTFGTPTAYNFTANGTTTQDDALRAIFANPRTGGGVSVSIDGKTYIYGTNANESFGRAELTVDSNGVAQLSDITYSADNQSEGIFRQADGSIDVVTGATTIRNVGDIGDGNKYLLIGNSANWQFVKVNSDGSLSAASDFENSPGVTNVDSLNGSLGGAPNGEFPVVDYDVNGTTYRGWITQTGAASDGRWWFYNPDTGFVAMTPQSGANSEEPGASDTNYYMINGYPTWIGTYNLANGTSSNPAAWVADGGSVAPVCFAAGTLILTDRGEVPVEDLRVGDHVITVDHGLQPIRWIGSRRIEADEQRRNPKLRPIRISAGALGRNTPNQTVFVSPQHRILLRSKLVQRMFESDEVLTAAKHLLDLPGVSVAQPDDPVEYFHIMFDQHELVLANDMIAESMLAGKWAMASLSREAREELIAIFPDLSDITVERVTARRIVPGAKTRKLVERSEKKSFPLVSG